MRKNIMFIVPTLCGGGAEKTVANLSNYLINDYNIEIVLFKDTPTKYAYSGNITFLSKGKNKGIIRKGIFTIKSIFKLRRLKKEKNIDYAISFLTQSDALNVFSKVKNCKTLISIRNTDSILMKNVLLKNLTKLSCKRCDHIVSISNQVKDDLVDNFKIKPQKITTIYNPSLKIEFGNSNMKVSESIFEDFVAINVGRLTEQKGQWNLIRAFSDVVKKHSNAKLLILGDGQLKEYLQSLIDDYGLNSNVFLLGFVDNPYDYIKRSSCFVFSSLYEGLGNSLLESLACGTPIISSDCLSGPREILSPDSDYRIKVTSDIDYAEYGVLVPVGSSKMKNVKEKLTKEELLLSKAICSFIDDTNMLKSYKKKAIDRSKFFDIYNITKEWDKLLQNLK